MIGKTNSLPSWAPILGVVVILVIIAVLARMIFTPHLTSPYSSSATQLTALTTISSAAHVTTAATTVMQTATQNFTGSFNYTTPGAPGGVQIVNSTKGYFYNSTEVSTGTYKLEMHPIVAGESVYNGTGSGSGTIQLAAHGYCSGSTSIPYTFNITEIEYPSTQNITIVFENANPQNYTMQLSCKNLTTGAPYTAPGNFSWISVYPNIDSIAPGGIVSQKLIGNISYNVTLSKAS